MQPETMNAVEITRAGGPEVLKPTLRPVPQPAAGQVLIKVAYAGVNRHDSRIRPCWRNRYSRP
jgi:NADPH:quinone reductase